MGNKSNPGPREVVPISCTSQSREHPNHHHGGSKKQRQPAKREKREVKKFERDNLLYSYGRVSMHQGPGEGKGFGPISGNAEENRLIICRIQTPLKQSLTPTDTISSTYSKQGNAPWDSEFPSVTG